MPLDLALPSQQALAGAMGSSLFGNIESFDGQILTTPPILSAAQEGQIARRDIVRQARDVERLSEHIRGGLDRKADMVVGHRLAVRATPSFDVLGIEDPEEQTRIRKVFEREFKNWAYDNRLLQDAEGHYDFGGMAWLLFRNITGPDGECAGIIHYSEARAKAYGTRWATFVQIYDPDRIETPPDQVDNPNVRDGFVFDRWNRRVGTFVRKSHPSDALRNYSDMDFELVPRETKTGRPVGFNWFVKTRAGQIRGLSTLVTILKSSRMLDKFDDAYLGAATINQVLATYIQTEGSTRTVAQGINAPLDNTLTDSWALFQNKMGYYKDTKMRVGGSRIPVLPPGDQIKMSAVNRAIQDPSLFRNGFLRSFASSTGISFEQISKNFSDANYSAARAALLDIWQGVMRMRFWFGQHVLSLIYGAVIEEAWKKGRLELPADVPDFDEYRAAWTGCLWTGPGFPQIDPEKEAKASKILLEMKMESREEIIAQRGRDIEDVFDEIANERAMAEERDFMLDPLAPGTPGAEDDEGTIDSDGEGQDPKKKSPPQQQRDGDGDGIVDEDQANAVSQFEGVQV